MKTLGLALVLVLIGTAAVLTHKVRRVQDDLVEWRGIFI